MRIDGRRILENQGRRGFTIIELLIVIAVLGILVALLIPAVQSAREAARRTSCVNNLRQLGVGLQSYETAVKCFPSGATYGNPDNPPQLDSAAWMGNFAFYNDAFTSLLPYLEQQSVAEHYNKEMPWFKQSPVIYGAVVPTYVCPSNYNKENPSFDQYFS